MVLEECKFAIEEVKKARGKWLIKRRREKDEQSITIQEKKFTK
jgi:hypothetical protein